MAPFAAGIALGLALVAYIICLVLTVHTGQLQHQVTLLQHAVQHQDVVLRQVNSALQHALKATSKR